MKKLFLTCALSVAIVAGCSEPEVDTLDNGIMPVIVDVAILTPEQLPVKETVQLEAKVTQGDENVDDADSVQFEVWESGKREEGVLLDGELTKDGVYAVEYSFDHDGVYYMFAHTTARGLHVMPKKQLTVGTPDLSKVIPDESKDSMEHMETETEGLEHK